MTAPGSERGGGSTATGNGHRSSAAEEAARLADALGQWLAARVTAGGHGHGGAGSGGHTAPQGGWAHIATGGPECRLCPLCQLIAMARHARPEVVAHLDTALTALLAAGRALLEGAEPPPSSGRGRGAFERIDIG